MAQLVEHFTRNEGVVGSSPISSLYVGAAHCAASVSYTHLGVEKTWPLHSPNVEKVEVVRRGKVRRAKLNYLRGRIGKAAKVKELVK